MAKNIERGLVISFVFSSNTRRENPSGKATFGKDGHGDNFGTDEINI